MKNFQLDEFLLANQTLSEYRKILNSNKDQTASVFGEDSRQGLQWLSEQLSMFGMNAAAIHVSKAIELLKIPTTSCSVLHHLMEEATNAIYKQVNTDWTYHYGRETGNISNFEERWQQVLQAFPSCRFDIESALDIFALRHYTASVFHFMRASEFGLRALAIELSVSLPKGKPLSHANWQEIIIHCDQQVKATQQNVPPGNVKDAALAFYTAALRHLSYLKDNFRNDVMHAKKKYDVNDAVRASRGTKDFLEQLTTKLTERHRKKGFKDGKIDWGF